MELIPFTGWPFGGKDPEVIIIADIAVVEADADSIHLPKKHETPIQKMKKIPIEGE